MATEAKRASKHAMGVWLAERTEHIAEQRNDGNSRPLWALVKWLKWQKKRPRVAQAPVIKPDGSTVLTKEELALL